MVQLSIGTGTLSSGSTILNYTFTSAGTHYITAVYGTTTSASLSQVVNSVSVMLASSKNPSSLTEPVILTATVNGGVDGRTVKFVEGTTTLLSTTLSGGKATFTSSTLSAASHIIKASYYDAAGTAVISEASLSQVVFQFVNCSCFIEEPTIA